MSDPATVPDPKLVHRFTKGVYDALEKEARKGCPLIPKDQIEAGYALGVERVLRLVREGFLA